MDFSRLNKPDVRRIPSPEASGISKSGIRLTLSPKAPGNRELALAFIAFLACSLPVQLFCSLQSPFYRYSEFPDASVYMAVGRSIQHGLMPYRDIFDHKGVLLHLINYLAAVIFPKSMTGIYLILSLSLTLFLFYGYRIARMVLSAVPAFIAALVLLLFSVGNGMLNHHGGGSTEEYFLPCLMGCLFYLIRLCRYAENKGEATVRRVMLDSAAVGFFCGVMMWIKYTAVPPVGAAFLLLYIMLFAQKRGRDALLSFAGVVSGILLISLPCLLFLWNNHLFKDMFSTYVVFNLKYAGGLGIERAELMAIHWDRLVFAGLLPLGASVVGLVFLYRRTKMISGIGKWCILVFIMASFFVLLFTGRYYTYYFLIVAPFLIFASSAGMVFAEEFFGTKLRERLSDVFRKFLGGLVILLIIGVAIAFSTDKWPHGSIFSPKTEFELCAEAVNESWAQTGADEFPRLVNFMADERGWIQLCDTYPQNKYFFMPGITGAEATRITWEQIGYIRNGEVDFVFTYGDEGTIEWLKNINPDFRPIFSSETEYFYVFARMDERET